MKRLRVRPIVVWIASLAVLVAAGWIISVALTPPPLTMDEAKAKVDVVADDLIATLPAGTAVTSLDHSSMEACPLEDGRRQYVLDRSVTVAAGFDRAGWMRDRDADYGARDGWDSRVRIVGDQSARQLELVDRELGVMTVTGTDADGGRLTFRATSVCAP